MSEHTVSEEDDNIRLDRWFKRHKPGFPHALLEKHLRKGLIRLDGKKAKTSDRVLAGQVVRLSDAAVPVLKRPKPRAALSEKDVAEVQKWVLYKDANVIVLNKPYGLAVQGGTKINRSLDDLLDGLLFDAPARPKLVHRLDRDTSGVLVLARNPKAAAALAKLFAGKGIEKTYWALVQGAPLQLAGTIDLPLHKAEKEDSGWEQVRVDEEEGKHARTEYRVLDSLARKFALMELKPLTGRMHQLRVHMAAIGCPIVGDHKYGGSMKQAGNSDAGGIGVEDILHLHARRIEIPPLPGGKKIDVTAPLPGHMINSFRALGLDVPKK